MSIKSKAVSLAYTAAKKCPPLRKVLRNSLFAYRRHHYNSHTKGVKTDPKKLIFCTFSGRGYSDSPRAIYEYMLRSEKYRDYSFTWIFQQPERFDFLKENERTSVVKWASVPYEKAMAEAKYWIFNYRVSDHIWPKPDQVYVECWHGTPLKRLGWDLTAGGNVMNTTAEIRQKYDLDSAKFQYLISPSPYCSEKFTTAWNLAHQGKTDAILEQGYPRNDALLNATQADMDAIRQRLHITPAEIGDKKVLLYAPTWRDNQHDSNSYGYSYTLGADFDKLRAALGEEYIILFRAHYLVASQFDFAAYAGFVYDVSSYPDINDLYLASDLLITDYSSVFFDYALLRRPVVFYMYDLAAYRDDIRGFYIGLEELPGPIVETEEALIEAIPAQLSRSGPDAHYEQFLQKFAPFDDGQASRRVVEIILGEKPNIRASVQRAEKGGASL